MAGPKDLVEVGKVCFYCSLKVPDKTSLAQHYVRQHWEEVRRRQGQVYRPKPQSIKAGNIFAPQPTTGQGGTVRRVSVMSADDERRMTIRKETLAAKRAQMPPQKIKLVYNRNKSDTANKGEVLKKSALGFINEELRKRQQMNMSIPIGGEVVEDIVKEACGSGDTFKQSGSSDEKGVNNSQVRVDDGELIEVVGKLVGVGKGQEFEFDEEAIEVEDELLGVDQGSDVSKVVGGDIIGEESAKSNTGVTVEKKGRPTEYSPEIAERSVSPIIMSRGKKARLSLHSRTPSKATSLSSIPSKGTSPSGTPTYGFDTPSPSLKRKSRVLSSLIMNDERKAGSKEEKPFSMEVAQEGQKKIGDGLGKEKPCEVRLVKLDKVHLLKATQGPGPGGDGGLLSRDIEETSGKEFEMETKRCDVKLAKLDKRLLSTKLPSVEIRGTIDGAKVAEVVDLSGDQDTTTTKKKSCVVRLAKLAMLDKIIKDKDEETAVMMTNVELVENRDEVFQPVAD